METCFIGPKTGNTYHENWYI